MSELANLAKLVGGKRRRRRTRRKSRKVRKSKKVKVSGKVGSKKNPYASKAAAKRGHKKGVVHYKKKGRTLKVKSKNLR